MRKTRLILVLLFAFALLMSASGVASEYMSISPKYVGNTMVDLSWTQYENTDFSKYELCRDGGLIATITDRTVTFCRDAELTKGNTYDYEIRVYNATGVLKETGTTKATTGDVHGTITLDTAWTTASSPYTLTGAVTVAEGATLTIANGVTVNSSIYSITIQGMIAPIDSVTFNGMGIYLHNVNGYSIKNCVFDGTTAASAWIIYGMSLYKCDDIRITNNVIENYKGDNGIGISLSSSNSIHITDNIISNNGYGIKLYSSSNNTLAGNNASNNSHYSGILLHNSSNNILTDNAASNNCYYGIELLFSSDNNVITDNTASDNHQGISLYEVSNNEVTGNAALNNRKGISLYYSSNTVITGNTASNSSKYGIYLYNSSDNIIHNNYFNNTVNGYDNRSNTWNITKTAGTNIVGGPYLGGNYWSDYKGKDLDGDRLGDTQLPYNCSDRVQNGGDWHPLIEIPKIILKASKDGYASVKQEIDNDENFERIELSGNVTDESTGELIECAKVEIVKGADPVSTTTSADGTYTITAIISEGLGSDTREGVNFELPPAEYVVGIYELTSEVTKLIEANNGTIIDQMDHGEGHRAYLVEISKEENIDPFLNNVKKSSLVQYVEFNYLVELEYVPNDPLYSPLQWGPKNIRAGGPPNPSAWDVETGHKNIKIAIIDSGIHYNHEDLYRFNDGTVKYVYGYDWVDKDDDPSPRITQENHGTHCTGIATAVMDNHKGMAGIAPNCSFMVEKVVPGSVWTISEGIYDALHHDADIISMSISYGWNPHPLVENACEYAWLSDCILVAAAGNQYGGLIWPWFFTSPRIRYPAAYPSVIAVGAIGQNNVRAAFSNWGTEELELVAPGAHILSTVPWNDYANFSGTSMATPHVAGVAALVKSRAERWPEEPMATNPRYHLNNRQIRQVLIQSAVDLGSPGWDDEYGYGKVDAVRAVRCVNISGNVLESVLFAPIHNVEVRLTSIEGPPGVYSTNENTTLARITPEGDYYIRVPPGVYSICAMAFGYIPSLELGGERMELPAFDSMGRLNNEHWDLRLLPLPCTVFGNVTDDITGLPINKAHVSLDGPPHICPPHPNVRIKTETNSSGKYRFILTYGVHPGGLYNISVSKSGYLTKTQNFTLNWSNVITDYYKCPLLPQDYNPPILNFSLLSGPSYLPDLTLTSEDIQFIPPSPKSTSSLTHAATGMKNIQGAEVMDASNTINSSWASCPPTIDGTLESEEWGDAARINITYHSRRNCSMLVMNDEEHLYIAFDVVTDTTNDISRQDVAYLGFDGDHDNLIAPFNTDPFYSNGTCVDLWAKLRGNGTESTAGWLNMDENGTKCVRWYRKSDPTGPQVLATGFLNHRIYEYSMPLAIALNVSAGDTIGFNVLINDGVGTANSDDFRTQGLWPSTWNGRCNFTADGDLTLATAPATEISAVKATIHNIGTADASDVTVQFFDGDPDAGGIQIGSDQTITSIPAGGAEMVSVGWTPEAYAYAIYVRADPFDSIQESNEENNIAFNTILLGITGDLNNDGEIAPADAVIALRIVAGNHLFDPATLAAADVNIDGQVTSLDALMILQAAAAKEPVDVS